MGFAKKKRAKDALFLLYPSYVLSFSIPKRRHQILDQVIRMFEAAGEAHQSVGNAEFGAGLRFEALVSRGRGMRDEALGVAEIVADLDQLERILEGKRGRLAAFDFEGDES